MAVGEGENPGRLRLTQARKDGESRMEEIES